jgi:hypothetical protein
MIPWLTDMVVTVVMLDLEAQKQLQALSESDDEDI